MIEDAAGLSVSCNGAEGARLWDEAVHALLTHGAALPDRLDALTSAEPGFAMGHALRGLSLLMLARPELLPAADRALAAAEAAAAQGGADAREREAVCALRELRGGRMLAAAARLERAAEAREGDAAFVKLAQALRFLMGDSAGMRAAAERLAGPDAFPEAHPHSGYMSGLRAFAREETGDYEGAEAAGRAGLETAPDDAWGLHAVAHVHDMTGRADDGVRWLAGRSAAWAHCANFGLHVWWHLALFHIDRGNLRAALGLYDVKVRPAPTDDYRDVANAASLLMRLELEGADVGERWEELGAIAAGRVEDGALVFADLHYLLALHRTGRDAEAARLTARIARDAQGLDHDQHEVCAMAGLPAARGLNAFRGGRWAEASRALSLALPQLRRVGGSHAQRDVFERVAVEAALRAGDCAAAEALLADRAARRGGEDGYAARRRADIEARRVRLKAAAG